MIIKSLLDLDYYKLTMGQLVFFKYPKEVAEYHFKCRDVDVNLAKYLSPIREEINKLGNLRLTTEEYSLLLEKLPLLKKEYVNFLLDFKFHPEDEVEVSVDRDGQLKIQIKGLWSRTILYETMILAIVSEIVTKHQSLYNWDILYNEGIKKLDAKIQMIHDLNDPDFKFADFGTRRRINFKWQNEMVTEFNKRLNIIGNNKNFNGTSNVYIGLTNNIPIIGTFAHEYIMAGQALHPIATFQRDMLNVWAEFYDGNLGIALTDTISTDQFYKDFGLKLSKLYDGVRHDSGCPIEFGEKTLRHYKSLNLDTLNKTIVFSDALTMKRSIELFKHFYGKIKTSYGIGTHLSHDFDSVTPTSIVIKLQRINGFPVAKNSDEPIKSMCIDKNFLQFIQRYFNCG